MARVLVVDDEHSMRVFLEVLLSRAGHAVEVASDAASAIVKASAGEFDVVVTDLMLGRGGGSGLEVLSAIYKSHPETEVIVMTAHASDESDLSAMRMGAYDYVAKPFKKNDELVLLIEKALEKRGLAQREKSLTRDNELLREQLSSKARFEGMVGRSPAMMSVYSLVEKVAASRTTVLITGESGVGKELVARAVHAKSPRANASFLAVNCGAIPEGLIESELFGHVKGAFTGAAGAKEGLFQAAHGGTLFLDEIGELGLSLQVKLLGAAQDRRVRPVGSTEDVEVDVRLVTATNRDLPEEVRAGRFREDLYYRLNVVQVRVPPLRERREDFLALAEPFLKRFGAEHGRGRLRLSTDAIRRLDDYPFPGNVRELENLIERAVALSSGSEVAVDALPAPLRMPASGNSIASGPLPAGFSLEAHLASVERELIDRALSESRGVKKDAAAKLGLTFRQLRHRIKKLSGESEPENEDAEEPA